MPISIGGVDFHDITAHNAATKAALADSIRSGLDVGRGLPRGVPGGEREGARPAQDDTGAAGVGVGVIARVALTGFALCLVLVGFPLREQPAGMIDLLGRQMLPRVGVQAWYDDVE